MDDSQIIEDYYQLMRSHESLKIKLRIQRDQIEQLEIKLWQARISETKRDTPPSRFMTEPSGSPT